MAWWIGESCSIKRGIGGFLPSLRVDTLLEISLRVHEADTHERNTQIAGFLAMVSGQNAETSAVNRNRNVESELGRKVGNRRSLERGEFRGRPGVLIAQIFVEAAHDG